MKRPSTDHGHQPSHPDSLHQSDLVLPHEKNETKFLEAKGPSPSPSMGSPANEGNSGSSKNSNSGHHQRRSSDDETAINLAAGEIQRVYRGHSSRSKSLDLDLNNDPEFSAERDRAIRRSEGSIPEVVSPTWNTL